MIDKMRWVGWNGSNVLRCEKTHHHFAWVKYYPNIGYKVEIWDDQAEPYGDWDAIALVDDLDSAKAIAKLNVRGELLHD